VDEHVAGDSVQIMEDLFFLASDDLEGRAMGSPGGARARDRIVKGFQAAGVGPPQGAEQVQRFEARRRSRPGSAETAALEGANVVGWVPGTSPDGALMVITAHYDHVGVRDGQIYNGADDNASGTAALLSIARYLSGAPLGRDVLLVALDGEERGLLGAEALLSAHWLDLDRVFLNVNLDMVSRSDSVLFASGAFHTPAIRPILEEVARDAPVTLRLGHDAPGVPGVDDWTRQSDHGAFHVRGIPFVYFGVEDHPDYHRPSDDADRVDPGFYLNSIRTILMAVRALDARAGEFRREEQR
jgi:Zn-dependent M28 family amino/carboxypeptidase